MLTNTIVALLWVLLQIYLWNKWKPTPECDTVSKKHKWESMTKEPNVLQCDTCKRTSYRVRRIGW